MMWIWDQQKDKKSLATDSDTESENETHGAGECSFVSTEERIEGVSGVTVECDNLQSDSEMSELIFGQPK